MSVATKPKTPKRSVTAETQTPLQARLHSLDALRGFDMFWIIGGDAVISAIGKLSGNSAVQGVTVEFSDHMTWAGFRFYDMIFPLFLFIIGAALPFSLGRRVEAGVTVKELIPKVLKRTALLILFGLIYNGLFNFDGWDHLRLFGVLQRQAIGYCVAALLFLTTKPKTQAAICVGILFFYWALMAWAPMPGVGHGSMTQWGNFANYVDRLILLPHQMYEKYGDPEGPISMIPAISTALLGVFAGRWLRTTRPDHQKAAGLAIAGLACLALGLAWAPFFPVIKKIWTSSYVLVAGGFSLELLALFFWVIDVKGWKKWSFPFVVIGMNPITIYMLTAIVDFDGISHFFLGGIGKQLPLEKGLIIGTGVLAIEWALLYYLYRQKIFLRV